MRAHPVRTVAMAILVLIVAIKLWAYTVLAVIALAALKAYRQRLA
jgi:hypothetical protein